MLAKYYQRVATWNSVRYERVYDAALTNSLLSEEFRETRLGTELIEYIDGYCDTMFVALGALWKLNVDEEAIAQAAEVVCPGIIKSVTEEGVDEDNIIAFNICMLRHEDDPQLQIANLLAIIVSCDLGLAHLGLSETLRDRAVIAICDSNDTKSIKKTDSSVKANAGDKGPYYVSPTKALEAIIKDMSCQSTKH